MSRLRALLHELADEVADKLESLSGDARYYDQGTSPLPANTHCRLVRSGKLAGRKVAGRVLVEREVMHAFIDAHETSTSLAEEDNDALLAANFKRLGLRRAG